MTPGLRGLARSTLAGLAGALGSGRLQTPYTRSAVAHHVPAEHVDEIVAALTELDADGMAARHIGRMLGLVAEERAHAQHMSDRIEFVWSPPDHDYIDARDTAAVVQELFQLAERSLLMVTYSLDQGDKARALFGALAERMDRERDLAVRFCINIKRESWDERPAATLVASFAAGFRDKIWPGTRLPEVFYDPRSLNMDWGARHAIHAKCVVADEQHALVTSANFSEAAQTRNIEAGVRLTDRRLAGRVTRQFERLVAQEILQRVELGET